MLKNSHKIRVKFNETDPLGIVWHGHYVAYFEEGREAFGREFQITYLDILNAKILAPVVKCVLEYKKSLKYGEIATIETEFVPVAAAKLIFKYKIFNEQNHLVTTGETIQVFTDLNGELLLNNPDFFENWKLNHKL